MPATPFDPRLVPALPRLAQQAQAQADPQRLTAAGLRRLFADPPRWQPELLQERNISERSSTQAAVLLPLVMREQLMLLLTQRAGHLSTHSGQIALPGGKIDPGDADATAAALRETQEEIGLMPQQVEVLGTLPRYTTGSAYIVTPVVGLVQPDFDLCLNPNEVTEVFEVPLVFLMQPAHHHRHALELGGIQREWYSMPYQDGPRERFIWGATAGMLRNFYHLICA
ncbi:CoA pyrophosphatase [Hydrogenophaga sp.]|uniref:CoA pyrophosphatase n=1 Tax=Hydrogenophaga sp. TaxID=1904254 RepID=UPI0025C3DD53|nr:CoA pyrophosphatase [Hydrogenophaga sp.]